MAKKKNVDIPLEDEVVKEPEIREETTAEEPPVEEAPQEPTELEKALAEQAAEHERYLLLAAEYDNFRKRTQREKDGIYQTAKADTANKFLPVYDNLLRALQNETADEAYKKGVEMTMNELVKILASMGIEPFGAVGEEFDPNKHNAVMHIEDETLGENVIAELFQTGFAMGEKIIRFAMVKVAN
ncbi:MAG: nucleotide exchange factor GrpE [Oscillospiraceae bacterium]|nr:nucleotide exchange factor GrpE [Oscillospiraceae bacterium]